MQITGVGCRVLGSHQLSARKRYITNAHGVSRWLLPRFSISACLSGRSLAMSGLDSTLGTIELGAIFSTLLFGIISVQAFDYYRDYPNDSRTLKAMVGLIWLLELGHMILVWHATYCLTITFFGNKESINSPPRTLYLTQVFSSLVTLIVRFFFANRIRVFSTRWFFAAVCWILSVLDLVANFSVMAIFYRHGVVRGGGLPDHDSFVLLAVEYSAEWSRKDKEGCRYAYYLVYRIHGHQEWGGASGTHSGMFIFPPFCPYMNMTETQFLTRDDCGFQFFHLLARLKWSNSIMGYLLSDSIGLNEVYSNSMLVSLNGRHRIAPPNSASFHEVQFNSGATAPSTAVRTRNMVIQMSRVTEIRIENGRLSTSGGKVQQQRNVNDHELKGQWESSGSEAALKSLLPYHHVDCGRHCNVNPELLERTLAHLSMRDLLVTAPLVSKTWQAITLTPTLQRALFFQPDPTSTTRIPNPLLVEMFPPLFAVVEDPNRWSWPDAETIMSMPWAKASDAFKRPEASWRRMFVVQPPPQKMVVTETCHGQLGDRERRGVINDLSLRMGILYDLVLPFINRVASSFCIRWHEGIEFKDGDLTVAVIYTQQCCVNFTDEIGEQFGGNSVESVEIEFGGWTRM
ncbi:O-methylsterigmatocystin oxidoreductase [Mycena venus]|uniref:O-methylsterigmatocystin oxidoreductase n=1 Tax=Mycena venus TaxID=2733690 RepID=A0A8H6YNZ8_9AGAR|nr:O-methylsterigmatocystin oxidoreductase [Mycena venus]